MKTRKRPGCSSRIGYRQPCWQAEMTEPARKIGEQHLFVLKEMDGSRHLEKKTVRAVSLTPGRNSWRITRSPQGQTLQRGTVRCKIGRVHLQHTGLGPCVGHLIANPEIKSLRSRVQGSNAPSSGSIDGKDKWPLRINRLKRSEITCLRCAETQDWPSRQPN